MTSSSLCRTLTRVVFTALCSVCLLAMADGQEKKPAKKPVRKPNPVFAKIKDDPKLPSVLLIGDSISIGYTLPTRELLKGKVNVHRIPTNGGPTTNGLKNIDSWLGERKWDVIHFNWGLHDLKFIEKNRQVSPDDYEKNLAQLVVRLKKTGAKLIWCNTTPVPKGVSPHRTNDDVLLYNGIAAKIMKAEGIATDDLYTFADEQLAKIQQPRNVHFSPAGSKILAGQVVKSILSALEK